MTQSEALTVGNAHSPRGGGQTNHPTTNIKGQNGNDGNTNSLDIKTSPPGTPQSNPSSSSTGGGGQSTGCGQSGGNTGGVCGGNKMMAIRVQMLDDSITLFQVQSKALGKILFEQVCKQLNLLEVDYFGLEYQDVQGITYWLDVDKQMCHQVGLSSLCFNSPSTSLQEPLLRFCVKFYTPDPAQIEEEYTRYLFSLQIKRDLATGLLQCNDNTAALMASYIVQSECGDYVVEDYPDHTYLSTFKFVPQQDGQLERRIMENHKKHVGQSPAEADLNLLETARRCELYGTKMHPAKDHEGVPLNLAVAHMGVLVFQNFTKINTFSWAKIRKLSFKRKKYLIKLHPEGYGYYKDTVEFYFDDRNQCKNFWKKTVENHAFFRCSSTIYLEREKHRLLSRGSSFRYSGRTQKQMQDFVRENFVKRQSFQRHVRNIHSSVGNVGQSMSVQPLLPIGENTLVPQKCEDQQTLGEGFTEIAAPPQGILQKRGETPPTKGAIINNNRTSSTLYQTALQSTSEDQNNDTSIRSNSIKNQPPLPTNGDVNGKSDQLPTYQSIFANSLTRQQQHQQDGTTTAAVSPITRLENGTHSNSIQNGNIQPSHIHNKSNYSPQRSEVITEMATSTPMTLNTQTPSTMGMPSQYSHHHPSPHSPLKFFREDSVDGTLSPVSSKSAGTDTDTDMRKKRYPTDRAYFIAKEILMTERTYKKDLEIINLWFRDEVSKEEDMPEDLLTLLFSHIDPIYELHCSFLKDIEQRMATWEGRGNAHLTGDYKRISDVVVRNFDAVTTEYYLKYVEAHPIILDRLEQTILKDSRFAQVVRDFESQKVCYLPLTTLIVKPLHRILHYDLLLERLLKHYNPSHPDYHSTNMALVKMQSIIGKMSVRLRETENFVKVAELQRDLGGIENLLQCDREFLREGCLQKLSRKGYQQRMFFLFSDVLIYANRTTNPSLHFRVHGTMTLKDLTVLDSEPRLGADFCFNLYDGKKAILLAAGSHAEKVFWMDDIAEAAQMSRERTAADHEDRMSSPIGSKNIVNLKAMSGSEDGLDRERSTSVQPPGIAGLDHNLQNQNISGGGQQRTNSSVHVCWHRSTTVAAAAHHRSLRSTLSGYLLRKFKSSNGWQKLWVVFTGACLYFFKTFQDDFPLASLPLLGYAVHKPDSENDQINKDYVFKLVFKNHVYFFRAESQYTFERWIEVLGSATKLSNEFTNTHGNGTMPIQGRF